jgi:muramoyltetrapeptide carboxypeptidase
MIHQSRFYLFQLLLIFMMSMTKTEAKTLISSASFDTKESALIRPPYLKTGDTIAIVATAGVLKNKKSIEKAIQILEVWGLNVVLGKHVFADNFHFAGTDKERIQDFQLALDDTSIKAILTARGGYGTGRIIDQINFEKFKEHPKWIIGYSDITVLHSHIHNLGIETIHGMMGTSFSKENDNKTASIASLKAALFGDRLQFKIPSSSYNLLGTVKGQIVGGNLSLLQNLTGTSSSIDPTNKILFIEDIGEYLYHIDRMLYGLKRNGYFENCKGLIIGDFSDIKENSTPFGMTLEELVLNITKEYDFPILFGFSAGHEDKNLAIIMGREIKMKVGKKNSTIKFMD